jgi:hypothetical protein
MRSRGIPASSFRIVTFATAQLHQHPLQSAHAVDIASRVIKMVREDLITSAVSCMLLMHPHLYSTNSPSQSSRIHPSPARPLRSVSHSFNRRTSHKKKSTSRSRAQPKTPVNPHPYRLRHLQHPAMHTEHRPLPHMQAILHKGTGNRRHHLSTCQAQRYE